MLGSKHSFKVTQAEYFPHWPHFILPRPLSYRTVCGRPRTSTSRALSPSRRTHRTIVENNLGACFSLIPSHPDFGDFSPLIKNLAEISQGWDCVILLSRSILPDFLPRFILTFLQGILSRKERSSRKTL